MSSVENIPIIPQPLKIIKNTGTFSFSKEVSLIASSDLTGIVKYFQNLFPFTLKVADQKTAPQNILQFEIIDQDPSIGSEGYKIQIIPTKIHISANKPIGIFYGIQTLRQLLPPELTIHSKSVQISATSWNLPCLEILDSPRFSWRGFMFDEGRHFFGKTIVKSMLDVMALHKLNIFHWHLTEDQGWRIEIKQYPKLTEIGSIRKETQIKRGKDNVGDGKPHSGFYTQADIKEIVSYAAERFITVVPEIEMPGHSQAALAAYPELGCRGTPIEVSTRWGIRRDVYCGGNDTVFRFNENILNEVMALFPSSVIHTGGDEVPKERWNECPKCQAKIKSLNLKDSEALQVYFTNHMAKYLSDHGRRLMGWNEILDQNLAPNAIGQFWAGHKDKTIAAINSGRDMVMTYNPNVYLDSPYTRISLAKIYQYEPLLPEFNKNQLNHVLGVEAPIWTEWVPTVDRLHYQVFPRLTALAEVGWSAPDQKNYIHFLTRIKHFNQYMAAMQIKSASLKEAHPKFLDQLKWKKFL